jgi:hypothetical protein
MKKCITLLALSICFFSGFATSIPGGSYSKTCKYIALRDGRLTASCFSRDGRLWTTYYQIYNGESGWQNSDGNLYLPGKIPGGSWRNSCYGSLYNTSKQTLTAQCENNDGRIAYVTVRISPTQTASNNNGRLVIDD